MGRTSREHKGLCEGDCERGNFIINIEVACNLGGRTGSGQMLEIIRLQQAILLVESYKKHFFILLYRW